MAISELTLKTRDEEPVRRFEGLHGNRASLRLERRGDKADMVEAGPMSVHAIVDDRREPAPKRARWARSPSK